jgi:hypothetical protein
MRAYNPKLTAILCHAGWKEGRDDPMIEHEYKSVMGQTWLPEAAPFVRHFGMLSIENTGIMHLTRDSLVVG